MIFDWCAGSFRGFVGGLSRKCGESGVDSRVMDLLHADNGSWVDVVGGKYGYHWIFRQCRGLVFLIIGGMAGEQRESRRIVTLKWCVVE